MTYYMKGPKLMPVNSIAQMMKPSHLRSPSKSPIALETVKKAMAKTAAKDEGHIPDLKPQNGVGHFVLPLQRIHFTYCSHNGDSATTRYLRSIIILVTLIESI